MAAIKGSQLPSVTAATGDDFLILVNDPQGSPVTTKISVGNFYSNVTVNVTFSETLRATGNVYANNFHITNSVTPAYSTVAVEKGKIWFDQDYLYVAVANNDIRRVALTSF